MIKSDISMCTNIIINYHIDNGIAAQRFIITSLYKTWRFTDVNKCDSNNPLHSAYMILYSDTIITSTNPYCKPCKILSIK